MKRVLVVGGGPAGLMAATRLQQLGNMEIHLFEQKKTVGRKFLVAGEGGFNLTHSEPLDDFVKKYNADFPKGAVKQFTPQDFRMFLLEIGIPTYVGSSGKVFPEEGIKPIEVLRAWLNYLSQVTFHAEHRLVDWNDRSLIFENANGELKEFHYDFVVFALGGASWKKTGSDGKWASLFSEKHIEVLPFLPSNSGVELSATFRGNKPGDIIKNCVVTVDDSSVKGDLVITEYGLEGKPIYGVNNALRSNKDRCLNIDFKPQMNQQQIALKIAQFNKVSEGLKALHLPKQVQVWLKSQLSKESYLDPQLLAAAIKEFRLPILGFRPVEEVISVVGGIANGSIMSNGSITNHPNLFVAGEMCDWDSPTGGYLIQACVSTGWFVANEIDSY